MKNAGIHVVGIRPSSNEWRIISWGDESEDSIMAKRRLASSTSSSRASPSVTIETV